jgi:hypothetical protein
MKKPQTLYRGIIIHDDQVKTAPYYGVTLTPFHPAQIDAQGRKTVGDGNEYGIYMTDNLTMVECAYGKTQKYHGRVLSGKTRISINGCPAPITYPDVSVIYAIDTDGLDVRKPWICRAMQGHYNNGFEGTEWIADNIPTANYSITKMVLAADWLHPEQSFVVTDLTETQDMIERIISRRKIRLQRLCDVVSTLPANKRMNLSSTDARTLVHLFGQGGACYTLPECLHPTTAYEYAMYLMTHFYRENRENLDWTNLNYVTGLIQKLPTTASFAQLVQLVTNDIESITRLRSVALQTSLHRDGPVHTLGFDKSIARCETVLQLLLDKYNESTH